jgi:hypothetical protein
MAQHVTWSMVKAHIALRIEEHRSLLERDRSESETTLIRGQIRALRQLITHFEPPVTGDEPKE